MRVHPEALRRAVAEIFVRAGSDDIEASIVSDHLVEACLVGHDSHGLIRVLPYVTAIRNGHLVPNRHASVRDEYGSVVMLEGNLAYGQVAAREATDIAIDRAKKNGIALVTLRGAGHVGRMGAWAERAAAAGQATIYFANSGRPGGAQLAPFGGSDRRLNAGPICLGMAVAGGEPIVLDISTAAVAMGKIRLARNMGTRLREPCIVDADGNVTDDPNALYGPPPGAVLPFGGHKGYGLCIFTDLFGGILSGAGASYRGEEGEWYPKNNFSAIHMDLSRLGDTDMMTEQILDYVDWVTSSPPRTAGEKVQMPGEVERDTKAKRSRGIDVDDATWDQVLRAAEMWGMSREEVAKLTDTPGA